MNDNLHTKFGKVNINNRGYYTITSTKEGNNGKLLHRLIFEDYYRCCLLPNTVIHHKDSNKLNNKIENLELMSKTEHTTLHNIGNQYCKDKQFSLEHKLHLSKSRNKTGYYRVYIENNSRMKQGFSYKYRYLENSNPKSITSTDLNKLEQKVIDKGLPWIVLDEEKARKTMEALP